MANGAIIVAAGTEDTHDLCIGDDGQIITLSGIEAYAQVINCNMRTILGEKQLDLRSGIPYMQTIFSNPNMIAVWEAEVRRMLTSLPFVLSVRSFDTEIVDGILRYKAVIETDLGDYVLSGGVKEREVIDSTIVLRKDIDEEQNQSSRIITFMTGDGVIPLAPLIIEPGKYIYLPNAVKEGSEFVGWYTDEELTKPFSLSVMPDHDVTLYPMFESWTEFEIIASNQNPKSGSKEYLTEDKMNVFKMRIWSHKENVPITIDWGDGAISTGCFPKSRYQREDATDANIVSHIYVTAPANKGVLFRIRISSNCFKFRIGTKDPVDRKPNLDSNIPDDAFESSHFMVLRLYSWSETIKNTYRTFSTCLNMSGSVPDFPKNMGVFTGVYGHGTCEATFEYTSIRNIVSEWPAGVSIISFCFAWAILAKGEIPAVIPTYESGGTTLAAQSKRTFYNVYKASAPKKHDDETEEQYNERIMPSNSQIHDNYVGGTNDVTRNRYLESWGGRLVN